VLVQNAITFTATVSSPIGTPTGSVTFYDNTSGAALGSANLIGGVASYTTPALAGGTHSITAIYSGDFNFASVTSAATSQSVLDFSLSASSGSVAILPGGAANLTLTVSPIGSTALPAAVSLNVSGLPSGATDALTPAGIAAGVGATTSVLTITVPQQVVQLKRWNNFGEGPRTIAFAVLLLPFSRRVRRRARDMSRLGLVVLLILAGAGATIGLSGCGTRNGFFGGAQQNYTVTITGTSGALVHSTAVTLTVE